jgi:hypothetical protein
LVTRLWAARQLEENRSEATGRALALAIEVRGALRADLTAGTGYAVIDRGDESTSTAATAATNTDLVLITQKAIKQVIMPLFLLPPRSIVRSPVIPLSQTLKDLFKVSIPKCPGVFRRFGVTDDRNPV